MALDESLRAYAPASIGNFAAGFDLMGAALAPLDGSLWGDVVTAELAGEPALTVSGPFAGVLPVDPWRNLVMRTFALFREAMRARGSEMPAIAFHLEKNLPRSSGLGSSAASVAATLAACQALTALPALPGRGLDPGRPGRGAGLGLGAPRQRRPLPGRRPPAPGAGARRHVPTRGRSPGRTT